MLFQCRATVCDAGPALKQHRVRDSCPCRGTPAEHIAFTRLCGHDCKTGDAREQGISWNVPSLLGGNNTFLGLISLLLPGGNASCSSWRLQRVLFIHSRFFILFHWTHDVVATLNQRHWRWFNVAPMLCVQWVVSTRDSAIHCKLCVSAIFIFAKITLN